MRKGAALLVSIAALQLAATAQAADYVGLGDSYSSGTGTASSYGDNCQRTNLVYPVLIDAQLPGTGVNLSCSGARTNHITADPQTPGNAQPQVLIPGGLGVDTDYVTLEIGGNDAGFVDVLTECGNPFGDCDAAIDEAEQRAETELPPKLDATYASVRSHAPNAIVVVVGYPRIFRPNQSCNTFFSAHEVNRLNEAADQLSAITRDRAHAASLAYVDAIPQFIGHGACDSEEWINGLSFSTPTNSYHPKAVGHSSGYTPIVLAGIQNVPSTTINSPPPNPSNNASPTFQLTSSVANSTFQCKLDGGAFAACSSPKQYTGLSEGPHTFTARAVNPNGDVDQTPVSHTWTIDTTAPTVSISDGPSGTVASSDASFEFSTNDASAALTCKLDSGSFAGCSSPQDYSGLTDGSHTFTVRAVDPAGNAATASRTWTVDTAAPGTTLNSSPANPTTSTDASFDFAVDDPEASAECSLDGDEFESCSSPASYSGLPEGEHTFSVRAVDPVGNVGAAESYTWTIDFTASTVMIDSGPPVLTNDADASFSFSVDDASATVECQLDGGAFVSCGSPESYVSLSDGEHSFTVRATDAASNVASDSYSWTVDTAAPAASITDGPSGVTSADSAELRFSSDDPAAEFECRLDSTQPQDFSPCESPKTYSGLGNGSHTVDVRAIDQAGNVGAPVSRSWTVDTVAPTATITAKPLSSTNQRTAEFNFSSNEPGSSFICRIDSTSQDDYLPCGGPGPAGSKTYTDLAEGAHSFDVIALDPAGNPSASDSHSWAVDTVAPTVTIDQAPDRQSAQNSASFAFHSNEPGSTFQCRVDSTSEAAFVSCPSPRSVTGLSDGDHHFEVRARDTVGNVGPVESYLWTSDVNPPVISFDSGPANGSQVNSRDASFTFHVNEEAQRQCKLAGPGSPTPAFGPCDEQDPAHPTDAAFARTGLVDGTYTLTVKATDLVNHTTTSSRTWTVDATSPVVTIDSGPSGAVNASAATFTFTASGGSAPKCSLDGGAPASCSSPETYVGLAEGQHQLTVTSSDDAGNQGAATRIWSVDLTRPGTTILSGPSAVTDQQSATFTFESDDPSATFQCSLDGAVFTLCASPVTHAGLGEGDHSFRVRAADGAGNVDASPAAHVWRVAFPAAPAPSSPASQGQVGGTTAGKKCKRGKSKAKRRKCKAKK